MKKMLSILIALSFLFTCALGEQADEKNQTEQRILSIAEEMAQKLGELSTGSYVELRSGVDEIMELVYSWGNGLVAAETPKRSTVIFLDKDHISGLGALMSTFAPGMEDYSDILVRTLVVSILNSLTMRQQGAVALAAAGTASFSEVRLLNDMQPGLGIVALDYGEELPWVFVTFWIVEGGAAEISTSFVYAGAIGELLMNINFMNTFEDLYTYLQEHPELVEEFESILGNDF